MKTRIAVLDRPQAPLVLDEVELPSPAIGQVTVKLFASGICHSQLHQIHNAATRVPQLIGHEATGVVEAVGRGVKHVKEGDYVFVTWLPRAAKTGDARPAPIVVPWRGKEASQTVFTWADRTLAPQEYVVKVPKNIPTDVTSIIGCAVMTGCGAAWNTAGVRKGHSVAVFGVGGVGLCIVTAASVAGASPIIAVDLSPEKLAFAKKFGATHGVDASKGDAVDEVRKLTNGGVDFAFDAIGFEKTIQQALQAVRPGQGGLSSGGTAVLVGVPQGMTPMPMRELVSLEKRYIGSMGGTGRPDIDFPRYIKWFQQGKLKLNEMVTKRYKLEQINDAIHDLERGAIMGRAILVY